MPVAAAREAIMSELHADGHRALQDAFQMRRVADALESGVVRPVLKQMDQKFIASLDMFFLSTIDRNGFPTVSYKGGDTGFVRVLDDRALAFPVFDGNGMYLSAGNLDANPKVGLLFIDFERPRRLRVHGTAEVLRAHPMIDEVAGAELVVRVDVAHLFTNCPRYIHKIVEREVSPYVPKAGKEPPVPDWKRVDYLNPLLPEGMRERAAKEGPLLSETEYRKEFWRDL